MTFTDWFFTWPVLLLLIVVVCAARIIIDRHDDRNDGDR
jgi:cell division protein FtsL